jgi:organic radical activating enzyme
LKAVFDENITNQEIENCCALAQKYSAPLVLQPKMPIVCDFEEIFKKFCRIYPNVRLIPQVHKFLDVR